MFFLKISNADVAFGEETLTWKFYITNEALPTIERVQLVNPKKFVVVALDADSETFIVHVAIREREKMVIDPDKKAQIEVQSGAQSVDQNGAQVGALISDKALTEVLAE